MSADPDATLYLKRGLKLRCPECGESRIFKSWHDTHSLNDWMQPLEGCPKCDYKYLREPGYFLLATWALNYGIIGGAGLAAAFYAEWVWHPPLWKTILCCAIPMIIGNVLFIRHSKAIFIAFDHTWDPQYKIREQKEQAK